MPALGLMFRLPCASGSGKFGSPCERMQEENCAMVFPPPANLSAPPDGPPAVPPLPPEPAGLALVVVPPVVVVVPIFATPGAADFPPHPARRTARTASPTSGATIWTRL